MKNSELIIALCDASTALHKATQTIDNVVNRLSLARFEDELAAFAAAGNLASAPVGMFDAVSRDGAGVSPDAIKQMVQGLEDTE
ncbi:hypothetical protein [Caballeronia sp. DA-9]|uniref:hypothetical protein n=1 Tax=Caballeronia sp. DA-9 TaxID=3436237 RepID=UPI003F66DD88